MKLTIENPAPPPAQAFAATDPAYVAQFATTVSDDATVIFVEQAVAILAVHAFRSVVVAEARQRGLAELPEPVLERLRHQFFTRLQIAMGLYSAHVPAALTLHPSVTDHGRRIILSPNPPERSASFNCPLSGAATTPDPHGSTGSGDSANAQRDATVDAPDDDTRWYGVDVRD